MKRMRLILTIAALTSLAIPVAGQQVYPIPAINDDASYELIFDGETLNGWEGDPTYWRVEDGALVGEVTPETVLQRNSFIIWRGGTVSDFELKVEYRVSAMGNSGINYRSIRLTDHPYSLSGYQADIDGRNRYTGQLYEERGRTFLTTRGQLNHDKGENRPEIIASVGDSTQLTQWIKVDDWNEYHLIVRGNVIIHLVNGHVMSMFIDDDAEHRRFEGLLGVQVHTGPPMKIEYRNFRLKRL
jgi:hypothetical protein